jgi:purine-binding chemotaxis protein CheW
MQRGKTFSGDPAHGRVQLVPLRVGEQRWALRLEAVERVVAMVAVSPLPDSPAGVRGVVNVHGEIVPVLDLELRLGRPSRDRGTDGLLVFARTARRRVALPVDEVLGVLPVDAASIGPPPAAVPAPLAGIAALPDGVLLVYDVDEFLSDADEEAVTAALAGAAI